MKNLFHVLKVVALTTISLNVYSQTYNCGFDVIQAIEYQKDSIGFTQKKNAFISNVNYFRRNNPAPNYLSTPMPPPGAGNNLTSGGCGEVKYLVPIIVHVIYNPTDTNTNIKLAQIESALERLNFFFETEQEVNYLL